MAVGQLSSLGLGSGVLNYDVIDKLKKADERTMIAPVERKMKENIEKQKELTEISGLVSSFKAPVNVLADYSTYLGRSTSVSGDAIKASVSAGVPIQDIKIDVESIAKNDINEVGVKFGSREDTFSETDVKLTFYTNGKFYTIDIKAGMSLEEVAQEITDKTEGSVMGIIMKTGGEKPYQLMINSKGTGEANRIYFGSTITSEPIKGLKELGDGDFTLTLRDKNGLDQTISIPLDAKEAGNKNSTETLKAAIYKTLSENEDFKDLLDQQINIGLSEDHTTLIINDRRGYPISFSGNKINELGLSNKQSRAENLFHSNKPMPEGHLKGKLMIGSVPLDLDKMTKEGNSSEDNAKIIAEAVENIAGVHASTNKDGKISITSEVGEVTIEGTDKDGKALLDGLGIKGGLFKDYSKIEPQVFAFKNLQQASDAVITYNGATITRATNDINDIVKGVNITLVHTTEPDNPVIISIQRDLESIKEQIKTFVKTYNELVPKLDETTRYDPETKIAGIFNGVSDIRTIRSNLNSLFARPIPSQDGNRSYSLVDYGMSLNEKSFMTLNEAELSRMLDENPQRVIDVFYGYDKKDITGSEQHIDGVFVQFSKVLKGLVDGSNAKLNVYQDSLSRDARNLEKDKAQAAERLKTRYETMAQRFAAYDEQIAKANNSFNSVQMMIDQAAGNNKKK